MDRRDGDVRLVPKAADMIGTVWRPMSALPPKAGITAGLSESPLCAKSRLTHRSKPRPYSTTSFAAGQRQLGIVRQLLCF